MSESWVPSFQQHVWLKLRGIIKSDQNIDYKKILTEELSKKYGV